MISPTKLFVFLIVLSPWVWGQSVPTLATDWNHKDEQQVSLVFIHNVGEDPLVMDTIQYTNSFGNKYSVATLKYFISRITFQNVNGDKVPMEGVFYIDAAKVNPSGFDIAGSVPIGVYNGVSFIFGFDEETNTSGRFLNPPENRMEWPDPMGGGYHYMKLEGKIEAGSETNNFQAHTGRLDRTPHFLQIELQVPPFTVEKDEVAIPITMDINKWWRGPNTIDLNQVTGIMGDEEYQKLLMENGSDVFSIGLIQ